MRLPQGFFLNYDNIEYWNRNKKYKSRQTRFEIFYPKGEQFKLEEKKDPKT